jgi:hypothetical protein
MKNNITLSLLFLFISISFTQELKFVNKPVLIYDAKHKEALIFTNDSVVIETKTLKKILFFKDNFPGKFNEYLFINVGKRNLFVHEGCGPVLEYRNDSLIRIDKSYLHRNQFFGNLFTYQNEIYFLGGYGLFTHKKILTKYSFENKEWELIKTNDTNVPTFKGCLSKVIDNNLYVFGGYTNEKENKNFYVLNLKNKKWIEYKSNIFKNFGVLLKNQDHFLDDKRSFYIINNNSIYNLDIKKNLIKKFKNKIIKHHPNNYILNDTVFGIYKINEDEKYNFGFEKYSLKKHIENKNDYEIVDQIYFEDYMVLYLKIVVAILFILILSSVLVLKKYWLLSYFNRTPFLYSIKRKSLFFKGKRIQLLNQYDILVLEKQLKHKNNYFALSDLNDLFSDSKQQDTMDVLIKRRETKLNGFIKTIAAVSGLSSEKICAFKKNETDKRIKEIQILPNAITYI